MSNEQNSIPQTFYQIGDIHPIKMTFLCEYPYPTPGIYAVYFNNHTKRPERVHLPTVQSFQTDKSRVWNRIHESAKDRLKLIVEAMITEAISIDTEQI